MIPVGLALSGGTAKSITHVGVIKALTESGISIDHIAGTSGGSVVATFYASGMPMSSMEQIAREMSWSKLISIRLSRLGFISSKRIEDFVRGVVGDTSFSDLKVPCSVIATDLETGKKRVFDSGKIAPAVRASCSIPQIFLPVELDGRYYVDGGFSEYLPVDTLRERVEDVFVIGSHLAHERGMYRRPKNYLQLAIHIMGLVAKTNYVVSRTRADVLIHPYMDEFSSFDFDQPGRLIQVGYDATMRLMPEIKQKLKQKSSRLQRLFSRFSQKA